MLEVITIAVVNYRRYYGYTQQDFANLIGKHEKNVPFRTEGTAMIRDRIIGTGKKD